MNQTTSPVRIAESAPSFPAMTAQTLEPMMPVPVPSPSPSPSGIKPLAYLRYRWPLVVFLGGLLATIFASIAWSVIPSEYSTYSVIRVSPQDPKLFFNEDPTGRSDFASYIKTQIGLLRSNLVLVAALRDPEVASLPILRDQPDPYRYLEEKLIIESPEGSELIKPRLNGEDPRAITLIVNAVHNAFFKEVVENERKKKQTRLAELDKEITRLRDELNRRFLPKSENAEVKPEVETLPGIGTQVAASQFTKLKEALAILDTQISNLEMEKDRLIKRSETPEMDLPPPPQTFLTQLENDPAIVNLQKRLANVESNLNYANQLNPENPDHPIKVAYRKRIKELQEDLKRVRQERIAEFQQGQLLAVQKTNKENREKIEADITALKNRRDRSQRELEEYQAKLVKLTPGANNAPRDFQKVDNETTEAQISRMIERKRLLESELNAPDRVQSVQLAAVPMKKEMKKQLMGTIFAAFMGFALVGLGVILFESKVRRVLSFQEVRQNSQAPILGVIPNLQTKYGQPTPESIFAEEAFEKTRLSLLDQFGRSGGRVIVVTSALQEEGRPTLAVELAIAFTKSARKTLIVDFDLRNPTIHYAFGVPNELGVCEIFGADADLPETVKILPAGLAVLPAGQWSDRVRARISSDEIASFLEHLRQNFEVIIVNTHPVLMVAESAPLIRHADAVILSVEKFETRLPMMMRAQEKIISLAPPVFGVVYHGANKEECWN